MKKTILLPFFLLAVLVFLSSCKKESVSNTAASTPDETISVKITPNQSYQMDLANAGTVRISRQAIHFLVSEARNNETGTPVYKYIPATDFTGNDEVVLVSTKIVTNYSANNSSGGCHNASDGSSTAATSILSKNITLKITVDN